MTPLLVLETMPFQFVDSVNWRLRYEGTRENIAARQSAPPERPLASRL